MQSIIEELDHPYRKLSLVNVDLPHNLLMSPFNVAFLTEISEGVVQESIRKIVLESLTTGFSSLYRGDGFYQRDFASNLESDQYKLAVAKMEKEVKKGYCIGPYKECPFPNRWCSKQAIIVRFFFGQSIGL